jgi:hypothetical protein
MRKFLFYLTQVSGKVIDVALGLILLSAAKTSAYNLFGVSFTSSLPFHKIMGGFLIFGTLIHGAFSLWSTLSDSEVPFCLYLEALGTLSRLGGVRLT